MNLILLESKDFEDNGICVRLKDRRFIHIRDILKAKKGDELFVGLVNGLMGKAKIQKITSDHVVFEPEFSFDPPAKLPVTVVFALPRPPVFKRMLLTLSSLGIKEIHVIHSKRVEKSYWSSPSLKPEHVREQLILGLEQAKDTVLPQVIFHKRFKPFVEDALSGILTGKKAYVAHPSKEQNSLKNFSGRTVFIIGPEGGFIPYEIELLNSKGVQAISMGDRIAKVETAAILLISRCM